MDTEQVRIPRPSVEPTGRPAETADQIAARIKMSQDSLARHIAGLTTELKQEASASIGRVTHTVESSVQTLAKSVETEIGRVGHKVGDGFEHMSSKVADSVQGFGTKLGGGVDTLRDKLSSGIDHVSGGVEEGVHTVTTNVDGLLTRAGAALDLKAHVQKAPFLMAGSAVGVGYVLAVTVLSRQATPVERPFNQALAAPKGRLFPLLQMLLQPALASAARSLVGHVLRPQEPPAHPPEVPSQGHAPQWSESSLPH